MTHNDYLKPAGQAAFHDSGVTKFQDVVRAWKGEELTGFGLLGVPLSKPSISHSGASFAPAVMRSILLNTATYAIEDDVDLKDLDLVDLGDILMHVTDLAASQTRIEETLDAILKENPNFIPVILGGDHSISSSTIKAFGKAKGRIGVIQFDAHHDLRNLQDGGPSNGTPFRNLIESGSLDPTNLVQIGIRNFSNSQTYSHYAKDNGVKVMTMREVKQQGMLAAVKEAYGQLKENVDAIYLSVDIDVLDQAFAPGCPAIGPGGMTSEALLEGVSYLGGQELIKAIDVVEIDPKQDFRDMTSKVGVFTILSFLTGKMLADRRRTV